MTFDPSRSLTADSIAAKLEVLLGLQYQRPGLLAEYRKLREEAAASLGAGHAVTLRLDTSILLQRRLALGVNRLAAEMELLRQRATLTLGAKHERTSIIMGYAARFSRLAGNVNWRAQYEALIAREEENEDPRRAFMKRGNLAEALTDLEATLPELREGFDLANVEYARRLKEYGSEDAFAYMPRLISIRAALRGRQRGMNLMSDEALHQAAEDLLSAYGRLVSPQHDWVLRARALFYSIESELGHATTRVWDLEFLSDRNRDSLIDDPEQLKLDVARAWALAGDTTGFKEWASMAVEAADQFFGSGAPRSNAVRRTVEATFRECLT